MQFVRDILANTFADKAGNRDSINYALSSLRAHLGMDVAYISEFVDTETVFREVDAPGLEAVIKPGDKRSLDDVYCRHILAGRLPELIPDTSQNVFAQTLPITRDSQIGTHMSVPIRMEDGSVYGMFCCLGFSPNPSLNERDLQMMRVFADMTARQIGQETSVSRLADQKRMAIATVLQDRTFSTVYQPIWDFAADRPIGFECLTRFRSEPYRTPDIWFGEAAEVGLGLELELATVESALSVGAALPVGHYLSINASPDLILSGLLPGILQRQGGRKIIVELTEHSPISDYARLNKALEVIRAQSALIAIDDAGAGYASLQHIVQVRPDMIKLDIGLIRDIDTDSARRALVSALIFFARETGCMIVAEGVETQAELAILRLLGVNKGQGYYFSKPATIAAALEMAQPGGTASVQRRVAS